MPKRYLSICSQADSDDTKVTELNSSSHVGYGLKHAALHGARRYDEAIKAFECMLSKLDDSHDAEMRGKLKITLAT